MKHPNDTDFDFLHDCANEDLEFLVRLVIDVGGKTNKLDESANFKMHAPDHSKYVDELIEEIQRYAGNTMRNLMRGYGVSYQEALTDTLSDLGVGFDKGNPLPRLEEDLLNLGLPKFLEKMKTDDDREKFKKLLDSVLHSSYVETVVAEGVAAVKGVGVKARPLGKDLLAFLEDSSPLAILPDAAKRVVIPAVIYIATLRKKKDEIQR